MGEFFHGWRRKAGCVLLVMALSIMAIWMRSYFVVEGILVPNGQSPYSLFSMNGGVKWEQVAPVPVRQRRVDVQWASGAMTEAHRRDFWSDLDVEWRRKYIGFDFGAGMDVLANVRRDFAFVPYWSFVLPLTILSAYLILWPGKRKTAQPTQNPT